MTRATVYFKSEEVGELIQHDDATFTFSYNKLWVADKSKPAISLTLPKAIREHKATYLFAFFFNMLPEGANKQVVCKHLRIDPDDSFSLLLETAQYDTIGAVTVRRAKA